MCCNTDCFAKYISTYCTYIASIYCICATIAHALCYASHVRMCSLNSSLLLLQLWLICTCTHACILMLYVHIVSELLGKHQKCASVFGKRHHWYSVLDRLSTWMWVLSLTPPLPPPVQVALSSINMYPVGQVHSKDPSLLRQPPVHCWAAGVKHSSTSEREREREVTWLPQYKVRMEYSGAPTVQNAITRLRT